jgi:hypothetical protein
MVEGVHRLVIPIVIKHKYLKIRPPDTLNKLKAKLKGIWKEDVMRLVAVRSDGEKFVIEDEEDYRISLAYDQPKLPGLELKLVYKDSENLVRASRLELERSPFGSVAKRLEFKTPRQDRVEEMSESIKYSKYTTNTDKSTVAGYTPFRTPQTRNLQSIYTDTPLPARFYGDFSDTRNITHFTCSYGKNAILAYEISTGSYKKFINPRFQVSSRLTHGVEGRVYITGGVNYPHQLLEMNLDSGDILLGPAIPTPRIWHASVIFNKQIWAIGGASLYTKSPISNVEMYSMDDSAEESTGLQNTWVSLAPLNFARSNLTACVHGERLIVGGGNISATDFNPTDTFEQWLDDRWIVLSVRLPIGLTSFALSFVNSNEVLVIGGKNKNFEISREMYVLDTDNGGLSKVETLENPEKFLNSQCLDTGDYVNLYSIRGNLYSFEKRTRQLSMVASPGDEKVK